MGSLSTAVLSAIEHMKRPRSTRARRAAKAADQAGPSVPGIKPAAERLRRLASASRQLTTSANAQETLCNQFAMGDQLQQGEESGRDLDAVVQKRVAEQMEAYTYSVTHDLRAPLRAVRGFAQALVEDYSSALDETGRDFLKRMDEGAARLDALINDLLQYSRLGRAPLRIEPLNVALCLKAALQPLDVAIAASRASIAVKRPLPSVLGDAAILETVLAQLVSNALKFVDRSVSPKVHISGSTNKEVVRIWISDNGIGIAPAYHQRIFGVFERLHSTEEYPGTGIGLALVSKGVERMAGSVGVESDIGEGSRFWIELPKPSVKK